MRYAFKKAGSKQVRRERDVMLKERNYRKYVKCDQQEGSSKKNEHIIELLSSKYLFLLRGSF